jgi:hypothetical protein
MGRQRCGQRVSVVERDTSLASPRFSSPTTRGPRLHGGLSDSGAQDSALFASLCLYCHSAASTAAVLSIRRQVLTPAALASGPMAAQVVPALCASSFRLCSSCSHTRPCIWRPILVHKLCHVAALRQSYESTTLLLSA